jgi:IS5 family transposase
MIVPVRAQKPLALGGITGDGIHIWDRDLGVVDEILNDEEFIDIVWKSFCRGMKKSPTRGRKRMALNRVVRTGVLKHIKNWSFRDTFKEVQRNLDYRAFTQVFDEKLLSPSTFSRNFARIDGQGLRELNEYVCRLAYERGVIQGKRYRQDTTVCETNIHYPTDSSLLQDGVRVVQRLVKDAEQVLPSLDQMRNRSKAVRNRALEIARAARSRHKDAKQRREKSYRSLLKIVRPMVANATRVVKKLGDRRVTRHLNWADEMVAHAVKDELDVMLPRVEQVIRQTRARICQGINDFPDKLFSLFEPRTCVIRKGKAHKPNEFGRVIDIVEVENGIVSDYQVLDGNPSDKSLLAPAVRRHIERFGRPPHTVATDRGFWSAKNEKEARRLGVKRVSIPATGKISGMRLRIQRSRWFRSAQRWRANGEGRIGTLKNVYGMDRCMYKGEQAMERWVGWCVLANNLVTLARLIQQQNSDNEEIDQPARQEARVAA